MPVAVWLLTGGAKTGTWVNVRSECSSHHPWWGGSWWGFCPALCRCHSAPTLCCSSWGRPWKVLNPFLPLRPWCRPQMNLPSSVSQGASSLFPPVELQSLSPRWILTSSKMGPVVLLLFPLIVLRAGAGLLGGQAGIPNVCMRQGGQEPVTCMPWWGNWGSETFCNFKTWHIWSEDRWWPGREMGRWGNKSQKWLRAARRTLHGSPGMGELHNWALEFLDNLRPRDIQFILYNCCLRLKMYSIGIKENIHKKKYPCTVVAP